MGATLKDVRRSMTTVICGQRIAAAILGKAVVLYVDDHPQAALPIPMGVDPERFRSYVFAAHCQQVRDAQQYLNAYHRKGAF
jgi:hypothetical protein